MVGANQDAKHIISTSAVDIGVEECVLRVSVYAVGVLERAK